MFATSANLQTVKIDKYSLYSTDIASIQVIIYHKKLDLVNI